MKEEEGRKVSRDSGPDAPSVIGGCSSRGDSVSVRPETGLLFCGGLSVHVWFTDLTRL